MRRDEKFPNDVDGIRDSIKGLVAMVLGMRLLFVVGLYDWRPLRCDAVCLD